MNLLLLILILMMLGGLPIYPYSTNWGYYPTGGLGFVVLILILVLALRGPGGVP